MRYFLVAPEGHHIEWETVKVLPLAVLSAPMALYYCEGDEPPHGATWVKVDGERGEVGYWPIFAKPPRELHSVLAELPADEAKETVTP